MKKFIYPHYIPDNSPEECKHVYGLFYDSYTEEIQEVCRKPTEFDFPTDYDCKFCPECGQNLEKV